MQFDLSASGDHPSSLLTNQWFGKALGLMCGCLFAPPHADGTWLAIAAIAGIALGYVLDLWIAWQTQRDTPMNPTSNMLDGLHLELLFAAMGQLAKRSGRIKRAHIDHAEAVMHKLGVTGYGREQCIDWYKSGQPATYPFGKIARQVLHHPHSSDAKRRLILDALADHANIAIRDTVVVRLKELGQLLGFPASVIAKTLGDGRTNSETARESVSPQHAKPTDPPLDPKLRLAYHTLEVSSDVSPDEVKTAYRRLVNRHHPDKLPPDATDAARSQAQAKVIELRAALDYITLERQDT